MRQATHKMTTMTVLRVTLEVGMYANMHDKEDLAAVFRDVI